MEAKNMENVLKYINKNFVSLDEDDVKEANKILKIVLHEITTSIKNVNNLFYHLFQTCLYKGSFFDGLKVSKPDEFDIDLKQSLPEILDIQLENTDRDGFVFVKLKDWKRFSLDKDLSNEFKDLEKLKDDDNYLSQEKVRRWMQSIVQQALNDIKERGALEDIILKQRESGPAVTLNVTYQQLRMDIDLCVGFRIPGNKWPKSPARQNTSTTFEDFLVIPKSPKDVYFNSGRYWRLSFPDQERQMIRGLNYCKPALKLLKKLRDTRVHNIPSYFIKTVFLWEIEMRNENNVYWNNSLTKVFLYMLETYKSFLERHEIPYFWDKNNNLLEHVSTINIENIKNYLDGMINDINRRSDSDPLIVAKHLLKEDEFVQLRRHFNGDTAVSRYTNIPEPEPIHYLSGYNSDLQEEETGISTEALVAGAAVVGIGAAILGMFAYHRTQRNQNN